MDLRTVTLGWIKPLLAAAVVCSVPLLAAEAAQQTSPPGGVLPINPQATQPSPPAAAAPLVIPGINERPLGLTEGPKIVVKAFRLERAVDLPKYGVRVAQAQQILDEALRKEPAQGYTINELQAIAGRVADYYHGKGLVLAQAFVPAQRVSGQTVAVEVLVGRLEAVTVVGNKHYSTRVLLRPFKHLVGQPVDKDDVEAALLTVTGYPGVSAFGVLGAGRELAVSVLGTEPLPIVEAIPDGGDRYDFEARYEIGRTHFVCPADLSPTERRAIVDAALATCRALGCEGFARVDLILGDDGPWVLEVNAIPGLTDTSLLPSPPRRRG